MAAAAAPGTNPNPSDANFKESINDELRTTIGNNANDNIIMTATSRWTKQRNASIQGDVEVGDVQVDDQAPHNNRRFCLGLTCPSVVARGIQIRHARVRRRRQAIVAEEDNGEQQRQMQASDADDGEVQKPRNGRESEDTPRTSLFGRESEAGSENTRGDIAPDVEVRVAQDSRGGDDDG